MVKVAVYDKDVSVRELVKKLAMQISKEIQCDEYSDHEELIQCLTEKKERYHIIFMDLESGEEDCGLETARRIGKLSAKSKMVYMTENPVTYVQQIFLLSDNLGGFLVKPLDEVILKENLLKLVEEEKQGQRAGILVRNKGVMQPIAFREIISMESTGHLIEIQTINGPYSCYGRLQEFVNQLPMEFIQCHKSYVVNMREILRIEGKKIFLSDGMIIPISKSRLAQTKERYSQYIQGMIQWYESSESGS
ncbi:MAG: LytTR family DNA-binding domain-containing protein [Lachnospiraceae bacterium]|nr:LytTR family DNA-binding domain-containing protein [Lachnospiraceae bacterium]